jgi:hypothetical protein
MLPDSQAYATVYSFQRACARGIDMYSPGATAAPSATAFDGGNILTPSDAETDEHSHGPLVFIPYERFTVLVQPGEGKDACVLDVRRVDQRLEFALAVQDAKDRWSLMPQASSARPGAPFYIEMDEPLTDYQLSVIRAA